MVEADWLAPAFGPSVFEFSVAEGDFSSLEIRDGGNNDGFHYFYDTKKGRVVEQFVLDDRPRVVTLCQVTLIKKDDAYSVRLRFWKRDKTKPSSTVATEAASSTEESGAVKASVDLGETPQVRENIWKLINFLQSFADISLPEVDFRIVTRDSAQLARALEAKTRRSSLRLCVSRSADSSRTRTCRC